MNSKSVVVQQNWRIFSFVNLNQKSSFSLSMRANLLHTIRRKNGWCAESSFLFWLDAEIPGLTSVGHAAFYVGVVKYHSCFEFDLEIGE